MIILWIPFSVAGNVVLTSIVEEDGRQFAYGKMVTFTCQVIGSFSPLLFRRGQSTYQSIYLHLIKSCNYDIFNVTFCCHSNQHCRKENIIQVNASSVDRSRSDTSVEIEGVSVRHQGLQLQVCNIVEHQKNVDT